MSQQPEVMDDDTLAFRRLLERFGSATEKRIHLTHRGKVRSDHAEDGTRYHELDCITCGMTLGPWRDR